MDTEINILDVARFFLKGYKTIILTMVSVLLLVNIGMFFTTTQYTVHFDIKPINRFDSAQYAGFNSLSGESIDTGRLYQIFLERLASFDDLEKSVLKGKTDLTAEQIAAVQKKIRQSYHLLAKNEKSQQEWPRLIYQGPEKALAIQVIQTALKKTNEFVRQNELKTFKNKMMVKEKLNQFTLEDIQKEKRHAKIDYDRTTHDRVAFLKEQAEIARALNIAHNTIATQAFETSAKGYTMLAALPNDHPYYLYGYKGIEKEIHLLSNRHDKNAFIKNLIALEHKERAIKTDLTAVRAKEAFQYLPITNPALFKAIDLDFRNMNVQSSKIDRLKGSFAAVLFGLVLGTCIYFIRINQHKLFQALHDED